MQEKCKQPFINQDTFFPSIFSLTVPPPLHSNLQSLLGITNKSLDTYTILEKQIKKRVERIQIELLYFPISYTERCGTCMTTLETVLKIETEKKLRKIKIRFFGEMGRV